MKRRVYDIIKVMVTLNIIEKNGKKLKYILNKKGSPPSLLQFLQKRRKSTINLKILEKHK